MHHKTGADAFIVLAENKYNELGELIDKKLHSEDNTTFAQSVDYRYNIRGWLTRINDSNLETEANAQNDYFGMNLGYNDDIGLSATPAFNGNISAVKWNNVSGEKKGYAYNYDALNRIKKAQYKVTTGTWASATKFTVDNLTYDLNGNIKSLTRKDKSGGSLDVLTYDYTKSGNQLNYVIDSGNKDEGFKDGTNSGNDYFYDANGNMVKDLNKGITNIAYNQLNLPSVVTKDASNYIEYIYDAAGIKLRQIVHRNDTVKTTDYAGEFIYEDDNLQFIQHEEGRIIPATQSMSGNNEYQYHLKDHLGNTRLSFTTKPDTVQFDATFETENATPEEQLFSNIPETRVTMLAADANSDGGNEVVRLNGTQPMGAGIGIPVGVGDTVNMHVYGYYEGGTGYSSSVGITALVSAVAGGFGGANGGTGYEQSIYNSFDYAYNNTTNGIGLLGTSYDDVPAAYINYILFDEDMVMYRHGFNQISSAANWAHEKIELTNIDVPKNGFIYVYITNESASSNWVYFDDMQVTVKENNIIQADDYYPFGLTFNSYQRAGAKENKMNTFQDQETIKDLDLNWVQFKWRNHDPAIGRFFNVDPLADDYVYNSPYAFSENQVIAFVELEGMERAYRDPATGTIIPASDHFRHTPPANAQYLYSPQASKTDVKVNASIGFQAGVRMGKYGGEFNFASKELGSVSLQDGFQPGNADETKSDWSLSMGILEIGAESVTKTETTQENIELLKGTGITDIRDVTTETTTRKGSMSLAGFTMKSERTKKETTVEGFVGSSTTVSDKKVSNNFTKGEMLPAKSGTKYSISVFLKIEVEIDEKD